MRLASRGLRDMDDGPEAITDAQERAAVQSQARRIRGMVIAAAMAAAAIGWLVS